ncbi:unnamed protein product [Caenorhabditis nigoni]
MADNNEELGKDSKIDSPAKKSEILEKLNSQEQKFDVFAKKLQSIEESVEKNAILLNNQNKKEQKPVKRFVLKQVFNNVNEFEENKESFSEFEEHYNAKWRLCVKRLEHHLGLYIYCKPVSSDKWSIKTELELKVVGKNQNVVIKTWESSNEKQVGLVISTFLEFEQMENEFFVDGNLTVEANVSITESAGLGITKNREFDESQEDVSDVILVVQDTKFYVSKTYLAAQSAFFKTLLLGSFSESSKSEIALSGIDSDDFQCFLEVLYGESAIDDSTVEGILHIADMYATPMVIRKCEEFLLEKSKKSTKKLLEMVARYNLENLKKKCMSEIKTVADIRDVLPPNTKDMDHEILAAILDKALSLH